jgi:hypothetical protein
MKAPRSLMNALGRNVERAVFHARALAGRGAYPNALIIGAMRSGTTSLYTYLAQHPDVCASRLKEPNYFARHYNRGEKWYRALFSPKSHHQVRFEATSYYLFHPLASQRVHAAMPDAKLIAILRNPTARAYSHYQHCVAKGVETLSFEEALAAEKDRLAAGKTWDLRHFSYVSRGHYAEQIERWLSLFPREQFLFLKAEEMYADPHACMSLVQRFLGLKAVPLVDVAAKNTREYSSIDPRIRERLDSTFMEPNRKLTQLTGIEWPQR